MKRLIFGLFAAAVALGGSAFTNATPKTNFAATYYVLTAGGTYVRTASTPNTSAGCDNGGSNKCWLEFADDQGESFSPSTLPSKPAPIAQSPSNGIYTL